MNVAAKLPGLYARPQGSVGSGFVNNQLRVTTQHSVGNTQGSKGVAPHIVSSGGLEGSPTYVSATSNPLGWEADILTGPFVAGRASDGVQVSFSLFLSVPYGDRWASIEHARSPTPVQ